MKNFLKYHKFIKKVRAKLPKYHPESGIYLDWSISICSKKVYNSETGRPTQIGLSFLSINQCPPRYLGDTHIYKFNWKTKQIELQRCARWS